MLSQGPFFTKNLKSDRNRKHNIPSQECDITANSQ